MRLPKCIFWLVAFDPKTNVHQVHWNLFLLLIPWAHTHNIWYICFWLKLYQYLNEYTNIDLVHIYVLGKTENTFFFFFSVVEENGIQFSEENDPAQTVLYVIVIYSWNMKNLPLKTILNIYRKKMSFVLKLIRNKYLQTIVIII